MTAAGQAHPPPRGREDSRGDRARNLRVLPGGARIWLHDVVQPSDVGPPVVRAVIGVVRAAPERG